jgi:CRISPR-associated protein Cas2
MFYLVSYDITDDRTRLNAMKYLKDIGYHLQKSVFLVDCDSRPRAQTIYQTLEQMIAASTDRLFMTPVCATCWDKAMRTGNHVAVDDDVWIV